MKTRVLNVLSLFASTGTLFCCALPALFVTLGMGATFAGLISAVPQLVWLSKHKLIAFVFAGIMLMLAGVLQWQSRKLACPTDPQLREACQQARPWSLWVYFISLAIYCVGLFFAYIINWF